MIRSPYPLEHTLGMCCYLTDTPGTDGILKQTPEDFMVEELPLPFPEGGPYLICRLTKRDWELQHAVKEIAKRLGISHRRIGWAGTKDKRAVTRQLISLYNVEPSEIERVRVKEIDLEVVGRSSQPLSLGMLAGNRFAITIRDCRPGSLDEQVQAVAGTASAGLPNYVGVQRFGVVRPVTHLVGERILQRDYEGAVLVYVGSAYPGEPDPVRSAREEFSDSRDAGAALHRFPVHLSYERSMLHHLHTHPGDYAGALRILPPRLLSMFVSAFQSYLFNHALSVRLEKGIPLGAPAIGDHLLFENGRSDRVTEQNMRAAALQIDRGRCRIALFIPGSRPVGETETPIQALLDAHGITASDFKAASQFVNASFEGVLRPVALSTQISSEIADDTVRLAFTLLPGQYATTVCREFMKADPRNMV
jgi:tRNA pseudouridine13 synthase